MPGPKKNVPSCCKNPKCRKMLPPKTGTGRPPAYCDENCKIEHNEDLRKARRKLEPDTTTTIRPRLCGLCSYCAPGIEDPCGNASISSHAYKIPAYQARFRGYCPLPEPTSHHPQQKASA